MIELQNSTYYRTCLSENNAPRPSWYSKELCLKSFILSFEQLKTENESELTILVDGFLKPHDGWSKTIKKIVEPRGLILESPAVGNVESSINVIRRASNISGNRTVIFAEDDYLWLTPALLGLHHSLTRLPIDYSTPYDHPVRYQPNYPCGADLPHWHNSIYLTQERHWRSQESTCMTFATTSRTLSEDLAFFEKYKNNGKNRPEDRELFRDLQGLGEYSRKGRTARILVGPTPSLATHAHLPWLAPLVDWEKEAKSIFEKKLS